MAKHQKTMFKFKVTIAILLFFSASATVISFLYYSESQVKSGIISSQQDLINDLETNIEELNSDVQNLQNEVKSKESTVKDLGNRLGLAQAEIELLKPTVKSFYAVGIKSNGEGVVIPLEVKLTVGTGLVSVNIKNVDLLSGAQESVRIAADVAETFTGKSLSNKDIDLSFVNEGPEIVGVDGPSAGSSVVTVLIAAIENKTIRSDFLVTGTIEADGSIGRVGGVLAKAIAARDFGAKIFLVPSGQDVDVIGLDVQEALEIRDIARVAFR